MQKTLTGIVLLFMTVCAHAQWQFVSPNTYFTGGNVGIGNTQPGALLHIGVTEGVAGAPFGTTLLKVYQPFNLTTPSASIDIGMCQPHGRITGFGSTCCNNYGALAFSTMQDNVVTEVMRLNGVGNVGIGTTDPQAKLQVAGNLLFLTGAHQTYFNEGAAYDPAKGGIRNNLGNIVLQSKDNGILFLNRDVNSDTRIESSSNGVTTEIATFKANGNVGIGTITPQAKLAVNGDIVAKKITVTLDGWADYVFNPDYSLPSLSSVGAYIKANHHLPDIPSADSVAKNGVDLGSNQAQLLKKIEELTLYVIQQQQQIDALKEKIEKYQNR